MKIILSNYCHAKIMHWVHKTNFEVSGVFKYTFDKDGNMTVNDTVLVPQKNTSTSTDIEPEAMAQAMYELRDKPGNLGHWHSHVNMAVFVSGTDLDTHKSWAGPAGTCVALIFNKKGEIQGVYYATQGKQMPWGAEPLYYDKVPVEVLPPTYDEEEDWDAEYEKNVTNEPKTYPVTQGVWTGERVGFTTDGGNGPLHLSKKEGRRLQKESQAELEQARAWDAYVDTLYDKWARKEELTEEESQILKDELDLEEEEMDSDEIPVADRGTHAGFSMGWSLGGTNDDDGGGQYDY